MGTHDLRADVQSQPKAISTAGHGMPPERLKNLAQALCGNGPAGIPHFEHQVIVIRSRADLDGAVRLSMSQGVAQEIGGNLLDSSQIAPYRAIDADVRDYFAGRLCVPQFLNHGLEAHIDILDLGQFNLYSSAQAPAREIEDVVDQ
jgi:hypothetical protein